MIKEAELDQAYNLGRQAALEKLAGEYNVDDGVVSSYFVSPETARPINERNKRVADTAFNRAAPSAQDKKELQKYTDELSSGMSPSRLGKTRVFSTPQDERTFVNLQGMREAADGLLDPTQNKNWLQKQVGSRIVPFANRRMLQRVGPSVHGVGRGYDSEDSRSKRVMYLPSHGKFRGMANNPLVRAHEYYHATDPAGMGTKYEPDARNAEFRADLYAGLSDFDLKDVARMYLEQGKHIKKDGFAGIFGDPVYSTPETIAKNDPHLDDQSRYRLFAGMAR